MLRPTLPLLCLALAGTTLAETPDTTKTYQLDPVVVTATQIDALRSSVPNTVDVLSKRDLRSSGETSILPMLSRRVPGLFVTERGVLGYGAGPGAAGGITIRGTGGSPNTQVLVLTDGRPQMMGLFGHPLPDTYVTSGVERVEVIRGPASLQHGTNAMGGVMNVIYNAPYASGPAVDVGASYGSYGTQKYELRGAYGFESAGISISGNHAETNGHRPYSSFTITNGSLRGNARIGRHVALSGDVSMSDFRTFDPGPASSPYVDHWVDITRGSSGIALENRSGSMQGALKAFYNFGEHTIYDGFHSTDNTIGALLYQGFSLGENTSATFGADYKRYGGEAENRKAAVNFGSYFIQEYGIYALLQQTLFDAVTLNAGARANHHSLYEWEIIPQAGIAFRASPSTTIRALVGKGFRSPTIRELYLFPAPTPTLEPERIWNYEIGLRHEFFEDLSAEITGYTARGTNLIRTIGVFPNLTLSNSGAFTHQGVEFSASYRPIASLALDATYGYLDPDQQTTANPRHKIFLGGTYSLDRFLFTGSIQHVARIFGADLSQRRLPDYTLLNARLTVAIVSTLSAYVAGENLLNESYQIVYDYPMPGRTFFAGLTWAGL